MVKFQFEGLEADDLRREQKIKKLFREMAKFQFYELEADDIRREQMRFLRKSRTLLYAASPSFILVLHLSESCCLHSGQAFCLICCYTPKVT